MGYDGAMIIEHHPFLTLLICIHRFSFGRSHLVAAAAGASTAAAAVEETSIAAGAAVGTAVVAAAAVVVAAALAHQLYKSLESNINLLVVTWIWQAGNSLYCGSLISKQGGGWMSGWFDR